MVLTVVASSSGSTLDIWFWLMLISLSPACLRMVWNTASPSCTLVWSVQQYGLHLLGGAVAGGEPHPADGGQSLGQQLPPDIPHLHTGILHCTAGCLPPGPPRAPPPSCATAGDSRPCRASAGRPGAPGPGRAGAASGIYTAPSPVQPSPNCISGKQCLRYLRQTCDALSELHHVVAVLSTAVPAKLLVCSAHSTPAWSGQQPTPQQHYTRRSSSKRKKVHHLFQTEAK